MDKEETMNGTQRFVVDVKATFLRTAVVKCPADWTPEQAAEAVDEMVGGGMLPFREDDLMECDCNCDGTRPAQCDRTDLHAQSCGAGLPANPPFSLGRDAENNLLHEAEGTICDFDREYHNAYGIAQAALCLAGEHDPAIATLMRRLIDEDMAGMRNAIQRLEDAVELAMRKEA